MKRTFYERKKLLLEKYVDYLTGRNDHDDDFNFILSCKCCRAC